MDASAVHAYNLRGPISLIIPAFNEAGVIRQAIEEAVDALEVSFADYEIIVVDDGSLDQTAKMVAALQSRYKKLRLISHSRNLGYGAALRTGFLAARFPLVAFTDADCQFYLRDLARLTDRMETAAIVVGYRVNRQDPWFRRFLSSGYNRIVRTLLHTRVRDCDCALKVFRRDALERCLPESSGFFVNAEMLAKARRSQISILETPVQHRPRAGGESKVSLREVPRTLRTILAYWWKARTTQQAPIPVHIVSTRVTLLTAEQSEGKSARVANLPLASRLAHRVAPHESL